MHLKLQRLMPSIWRKETLKSKEELFQIIYQRTPNQSELEHMRSLPTIPPEGDLSSVFRALINGFDHQSYATGFSVRFSGEDIEYVSVLGSQVAIDRMDLSIGLPLKWGVYEPHLVQFYQDRVKPGMTFIDIGANIGTYSMLAARLVGEEGRVLSFEPNSENCRLILLGANRNKYQNIALFPVALGNANGHMLFATHIGSNGGFIQNEQKSLESPTCTVVPMFRLDGFIDERIDFIKIDVEGAEGLVMQGAVSLIEKYRPIITSEFSLEMLQRVSGVTGVEYLRFFSNRGYQINRIDREKKSLILVSDIEEFVRDYGELTRIEDMAFLPA